MHRIQQHILKQLILHPSLRYSQLKPDNVESNLFMYHLRQLMKSGLVSKESSGDYCLTAEGQSYADKLSLKTLQPRQQSRIVTLLMLRNDDGQYLLYRRTRQPLIGMVGFPYGKVHIGEKIATAAQRELFEKTGLRCDLAHAGDGYITMAHAGEVVSQIFFHLFKGENPDGQLINPTTTGEAFWSDPRHVPGWELMPSVIDLIDAACNSSERFFLERSYQLDASAGSA